MAEDETITQDDVLEADEPQIANDLDFSDVEIEQLEQEFTDKDDEAQTTGASDAAESEKEEPDEGDVYEEEEEGAEVDDEETGEAEEESQEEEGEEEESSAGYELVVDGQQVLIDTEEELARWAQKGIHYERRAQETQKRMEDATFTLNAMLNDPINFLEEYYTEQLGGNNEAARGECYKICAAYVKPILDEIAADPASRAKLQQDRWQKRQQQQTQRAQLQQQQQFTQEDLTFIRDLERNIVGALEKAGLPGDSAPLRKRMADVMLAALERNEQIHPIDAAEFIKREQADYQNALKAAVPKGQPKEKRSKEEKEAAIKKARQKRSRKKVGTGSAAGRARRQEPRYITGREFLEGINTALNLEP